MHSWEEVPRLVKSKNGNEKGKERRKKSTKILQSQRQILRHAMISFGDVLKTTHWERRSVWKRGEE